MPNWCEQRLCFVGEPEEVKAFTDLVNSLPERDTHKCDFGPFWLGNLVTALGGDWEKVSCRGSIAYCGGFCGPSELEDDYRFEVEGNGDRVFMTFVSAWEPCYDLLDMISEKYPSLVIYHEEEDEFYNFTTRYDPNNILSDGKYRLITLDGQHIETDDLSDIVKLVNNDTGANLAENCGVSEIDKAISEFNKKHEDDCSFIEFLIYEDAD